MDDDNLQCTYRTTLNFLTLAIAFAFAIGTLWASLEWKDIRIGVVTALTFLCTLYLALRIANQRVALVQEKLITYSLWNKKTEYDIKDIKKIAVANQLRTKYIKIYFGDKNVIVRKDIKDYDLFLKMICERLHITGYTRSGVSEFKMR